MIVPLTEQQREAIATDQLRETDLEYRQLILDTALQYRNYCIMTGIASIVMSPRRRRLNCGTE